MKTCSHCGNNFSGPSGYTGKFCPNCYLNWWLPLYFSSLRQAAVHLMANDDNLPNGHHGSSLNCTHPFCVAERKAISGASSI